MEINVDERQGQFYQSGEHTLPFWLICRLRVVAAPLAQA